MKKWKEAASVILAASRGNVTSFSGSNQNCRVTSKEEPDFQILALKKSSNSPTVAGRYVFPGGTANVADSSNEWIQLFKKFGYSIDSLNKSLNNSNTKLTIFEDNINKLPPSIALRILAIRETFEETGILLCKRTICKELQSSTGPVKAEHFNIAELSDWRKKVSNDPHEFFNLCFHNDCYPDLSSLYLWSNWLTPPDMKVRFNSVFFTAFLENPVHATEDNYEIASLKWTTALDLLSEFYDGKAELHFPQFYLLSCLARFSSLSNLFKFSFETNGAEKQLIMPVRILPKDGEIGLLPGDDFYPKNLDNITPFSIKDDTKSIESFQAHHMHRMVVNKKTPHLIKMVVSNIEENAVKSILPWYPDCPEQFKKYL